VSAANVDRGDTKGIWFFVNGRYVRDRMLARVTTDAFREMVDRGRYPNLIVYLDVSPEAIDVNVHPQKLEVRFSDGASVYRILAASLAVAAAVARDAAPQNSEHQGRVEAATHRFFRAESRVREGHPPVRKSSITQGEPGRQADDWAMPSSQASSAMKAPRRDEYEENSTSFSTHRWGEYIAHFVDDSLVVACPKKARQQLCYVQLLAECERGCVANRALMLPPVIEVSRDVSPDRLDRLSQAGFVFEVVGPHRLGLVSMPQAIPDSQGDLVAAALQAVLVAGVGADEDVLSRVCLALFTDTQLPLSRTEVEQLRVSSPRLHGGPCFAIHSREEMVRSLRGA
jgi:DNA mismatch repair protein MutL